MYMVKSAEFDGFMANFEEDFSREFNLIIEGISVSKDSFITPTFKLASIDVPKNTEILKDGIYTYELTANTPDFESIFYFLKSPLERNPGYEEIESLVNHPGPILKVEKGKNGTMVYPECFIDYRGDIYVNREVEDKKDYLRKFLAPFEYENRENKNLLKSLEFMFEADSIQEEYKEYVAGRKSQ